MLSLAAFITKYNGDTNVGDTPANMGECVGLIEVWDDNLGEPHIWGNADTLMANANTTDFVVTDYSAGLIPVAGDIICWQAGWEGSSVGHTAIVVTAATTSFTVFEQNDLLGGGTGACRLHAFNGYTGVEGWIHPKVLDNQVSGDTDMISADDVNNLYLVFLGREFGSNPNDADSTWVGGSWHDAYYGIKDSVEAQAYRLTLSTQLTGLENQVADLEETVKQLQSQPPATPTPTPPTLPVPQPPVLVPPVTPSLWTRIVTWLKSLFNG